MIPWTEAEMFRCFICNKYRPIKQAKSVLIKGSILPKDVCEGCWKEASKNGVQQQTEKDLVEKKK